MYLLFNTSRTFRFAEEIMMEDDDWKHNDRLGWDKGEVRQYDARSQ
jgi:hypothetical protein